MNTGETNNQKLLSTLFSREYYSNGSHASFNYYNHTLNSNSPPINNNCNVYTQPQLISHSPNVNNSFNNNFNLFTQPQLFFNSPLTTNHTFDSPTSFRNSPNVLINNLSLYSPTSVAVKRKASRLLFDSPNKVLKSICQCGSSEHSRISHSSCPLNKNNYLKQSNIYDQQATNDDQRERCQCGSYEHSRISHSSCPLNKNNNLPLSNIFDQQATNDDQEKKCQCGSSKHSRISHSSCPLNKNKQLTTHTRMVIFSLFKLYFN